MDKIIEQKKGLKKKHIPYIAGGAFALLFIGWLIFGNHSATLRVEKDKITIEAIKKGTFNDYIRIMGNVEPIMFFQLSALEGGRVVEKVVEEGALAAGQISDLVPVLRSDAVHDPLAEFV